MSAKIAETVNVNFGLNFVALDANSVVSANSTYYSLAQYDRAMFVITTGNVADGTLTIEMRQSVNSNPLGSTTISTVSNVNIAATVNTFNCIEVRGTELDTANAYYYVGVRVYELTGGTSHVSGICLRTPSRLPQATLPA